MSHEASAAPAASSDAGPSASVADASIANHTAVLMASSSSASHSAASAAVDGPLSVDSRRQRKPAKAEEAAASSSAASSAAAASASAPVQVPPVPSQKQRIDAMKDLIRLLSGVLSGSTRAVDEESARAVDVASSAWKVALVDHAPLAGFIKHNAGRTLLVHAVWFVHRGGSFRDPEATLDAIIEAIRAQGYDLARNDAPVNELTPPMWRGPLHTILVACHAAMHRPLALGFLTRILAALMEQPSALEVIRRENDRIIRARGDHDDDSEWTLLKSLLAPCGVALSRRQTELASHDLLGRSEQLLQLAPALGLMLAKGAGRSRGDMLVLLKACVDAACPELLLRWMVMLPASDLECLCGMVAAPNLGGRGSGRDALSEVRRHWRPQRHRPQVSRSPFHAPMRVLRLVLETMHAYAQRQQQQQQEPMAAASSSIIATPASASASAPSASVVEFNAYPDLVPGYTALEQLECDVLARHFDSDPEMSVAAPQDLRAWASALLERLPGLLTSARVLRSFISPRDGNNNAQHDEAAGLLRAALADPASRFRLDESQRLPEGLRTSDPSLATHLSRMSWAAWADLELPSSSHGPRLRQIIQAQSPQELAWSAEPADALGHILDTLCHYSPSNAFSSSLSPSSSSSIAAADADADADGGEMAPLVDPRSVLHAFFMLLYSASSLCVSDNTRAPFVAGILARHLAQVYISGDGPDRQDELEPVNLDGAGSDGDGELDEHRRQKRRMQRQKDNQQRSERWRKVVRFVSNARPTQVEAAAVGSSSSSSSNSSSSAAGGGDDDEWSQRGRGFSRALGWHLAHRSSLSRLKWWLAATSTFTAGSSSSSSSTSGDGNRDRIMCGWTAADWLVDPDEPREWLQVLDAGALFAPPGHLARRDRSPLRCALEFQKAARSFPEEPHPQAVLERQEWDAPVVLLQGAYAAWRDSGALRSISEQCGLSSSSSSSCCRRLLPDLASIVWHYACDLPLTTRQQRQQQQEQQ